MKINTYLGFDVGTRRTGVAIANSLTNFAKGFAVVKNHKNGSYSWGLFDQVIKAQKVDLFIVGLPLAKDLTNQEMTFIARSFGTKLTQRYSIEVVFIDEYLSSIEAKKNLKYNHFHPNSKREEVDKQSAEIILQTWLNEQN